MTDKAWAMSNMANEMYACKPDVWSSRRGGAVRAWTRHEGEAIIETIIASMILK